MAKILRTVLWTLERKCPFRDWDDWTLPSSHDGHLWDLRNYVILDRDQLIVDGICVTRYLEKADESGEVHCVPTDGFRIEDQLEDQLKGVGGLAAARATCQGCEANVITEQGVDVAGCFGYLDLLPDSDELEQAFWKVLKERRLERRFRSTFPVTKPLSYGLWINSPLQPGQAELLYELLNAVEEQFEPMVAELQHFLAALQIAIRWSLPVHVSLPALTPDHIAWVDAIAPCPRCKAQKSANQSVKNDPASSHLCQVCGHRFTLESSSRNEPIDDDEVDVEEQDLEKLLGKRAYRTFARKFVIQQGATSEQADQVIGPIRNQPKARQIQDVRLQRNETLDRMRRESSGRSPKKPAQTLSVPLPNWQQLDFVLIPAGQFQMGSSNPSDNAAQHLVRIARPFYMSRFLVTQAQWIAVMGWDSSRYRASSDLPVDYVSWYDCQDFCEALCRKHEMAFRLPSEAEWEYACRAGTTTAYAFGDTLSTEQANVTPRTNRKIVAGIEIFDVRGVALTPAGKYPANNWGLFDMHGNVNEWCDDVYHDSYAGAPDDGRAWLDGEETNSSRVIRGGWCKASDEVCTSFHRDQQPGDCPKRRGKEYHTRQDEDRFDVSTFLMIYVPVGCRVVCECP